MDIKTELDSYYNGSRFLCICWWQFYVISNKFHLLKQALFLLNKITKKYLFGQLKTWHVFLLSVWLANKWTIRRIYTVRECSVHHSLVSNPAVNILEPVTNSALLGTTWQFYLLIKFHCRFQRQNSVDFCTGPGLPLIPLLDNTPP